MIVSWNWLTEYVRLDMPVEALTERLALTGLNHESTEEVGGDLAIDLEVTSNRPDCLGMLGVAREIGVLFVRPFREPDPRPRAGGPPVARRTSVQIEAPDLCPRFTARVITGVTVGESPWWLRKRLETIGVRPISNIVDITNYVMFECGQPLHAYDLDHLVQRRLVVRRAQRGEQLRAINQKVYELSPDMLVIADALRPVGLGGVMGGLDTEIGPATSNVLIEAAQFEPMNIRRTARALGLFSPSSYRFERPVDPERTEWASRRCAELVLDLAGGTLDEGVVDVGSPPPARPEIALRFRQIARILGIDVPREEAVRILKALGLAELGQTDEAVTVRAPSWRADLEREIDLIEEVARVHGYEHIPEDRPVPLVRSLRTPRERVEEQVRSALTGMGFDEAYTFSLISADLLAWLEPTDASPPLKVDHSSRRKENILRTSLIPGLLAARAHNEAHGSPDARLFEIANVYLPRLGDALPGEPTRLAMAAGLDLLGLKGVVEALLGRLHVEAPLTVAPITNAIFTAGRAGELRLGADRLGVIGEVDRETLDRLGVRGACSAAELDLGVLIAHARLVPGYRPLPEQPAVARDLSLVVPVELPWAELASVVSQAAGPLLESLEFLDTFQGGDVPDGKHSLHFGLRFRHPERTLTSEEVERAVKAVVETCGTRFEAALRT